MIKTDLHIGREGEKTENQEKSRDSPLDPLQFPAWICTITGLDPAPFECQSIQPDTTVNFDRHQQYQVERPPATTPHAISGGIGTDIGGMHHHLVEMGKGEEH